MIVYKKGDLIKAEEYNVIVHGCNCPWCDGFWHC